MKRLTLITLLCIGGPLAYANTFSFGPKVGIGLSGMVERTYPRYDVELGVYGTYTFHKIKWLAIGTTLQYSYGSYRKNECKYNKNEKHYIEVVKPQEPPSSVYDIPLDRKFARRHTIDLGISVQGGKWFRGFYVGGLIEPFLYLLYDTRECIYYKSSQSDVEWRRSHDNSAEDRRSWGVRAGPILAYKWGPWCLSTTLGGSTTRFFEILYRFYLSYDIGNLLRSNQVNHD